VPGSIGLTVTLGTPVNARPSVLPGVRHGFLEAADPHVGVDDRDFSIRSPVNTIRIAQNRNRRHRIVSVGMCARSPPCESARNSVAFPAARSGTALDGR
jgi:hypothetical protein